MKVSDIVAIIEEFAPASIQEKWDNTGLQIGSPEQEVRGIMLGFDPLIAHLKQECIYADRVMKIEDIPALIQARVVAKSPSERIAFAEERLLKPNGSRPRSRKALTSHVAAMFLKALSETDLAVVIDGLFAKGCVRENGKRIEYADENRMCS